MFSMCPAAASPPISDPEEAGSMMLSPCLHPSAEIGEATSHLWPWLRWQAQPSAPRPLHQQKEPPLSTVLQPYSSLPALSRTGKLFPSKDVGEKGHLERQVIAKARDHLKSPPVPQRCMSPTYPLGNTDSQQVFWSGRSSSYSTVIPTLSVTSRPKTWKPRGWWDWAVDTTVETYCISDLWTVK